MLLSFLPLWEIHPATIHLPIGLLLAGVVLDLYAWWRGRPELVRIALGLLVAGVLTGLIALTTGFLAFFTLPHTHTEEAHRLMFWHFGLQTASLLVFILAILVRWRGRRWAASALPNAIIALGTILLIIGAYLGGYLVYRGAAGVDPTLLSPELRAGHHHAPGEHHDLDSHHHEHEAGG